MKFLIIAFILGCISANKSSKQFFFGSDEEKKPKPKPKPNPTRSNYKPTVSSYKPPKPAYSEITNDDECEIVTAAYNLCEQFGRDEAHTMFKTWCDNRLNKNSNAVQAVKKFWQPSARMLLLPCDEIQQILDVRIGPAGFKVNLLDLRESMLEKTQRNEGYLKDLEEAARLPEKELNRHKQTLLNLAHSIYSQFNKDGEPRDDSDVPIEVLDDYHKVFGKKQLKDQDFKESSPLFQNIREKIPQLSGLISKLDKSLKEKPYLKELIDNIKGKIGLMGISEAATYSGLNAALKAARDFAIKLIQTNLIKEMNLREAQFRQLHRVVDKHLCRGSSNKNWVQDNCLYKKKKMIRKE